MRQPAAAHWRDALGEWRIPPEILAGCGSAGSPWALPAATFAARAEEQVQRPSGTSYEIALEALPQAGSVLDVGAGVGAASLALRERAASIIAVDESAEMLARLAALASSIKPEPGTAAIAVSAVRGRWPDAEQDAGAADVVVCHHVLYNVPDIDAFVRALTSHARRRVVVEMTDRHPQSTFNPMWMAVHGLPRPDVPVASDAIAAIAETGVTPQWRTWRRPMTPAGASWPDLVDAMCRRLCVDGSRRPDVERALLAAGASPDRPFLGDPFRDLVTIWWDPTVR